MPSPTPTSRCAGSSWPSRSRRSRWRSPRSCSAATPGCPCTPPATSARSTSRSASGSSTRRGSRRASRGCCPVVAALVVCLVGSSFLDVATGSTRALGEAQHVLDFVGLAVVWLLSRPGAATGAARVIALAAPSVACSRWARSSSPWWRCSPRPRRRTRRCCRPIRRTVASTTRHRRRSRCASPKASRSRSAASASTRAIATACVTGKPEHPNGQQSVVTTSLPKLDNGTYVVTWRVISADSHPIDGAYTFQVGSKATLSDKNAKNAAASLLATTGGQPHRRRRVRHRPRVALRGARAAHRRRGVPRRGVAAGRDDRRAKWLVWSGWIAVIVTTVFGIALEGRVRRRPPARATCSTPPCSATCSTRATATSRWCDSRCSCSRSRCCACCCTAVPRPSTRCAGGGSSRALRRRRGHRGHARHRRPRRPPASRPGSRSRPTSCTWRAWRAGSAASCAVRRGAARGATSTSCARCSRATPRSRWVRSSRSSCPAAYQAWRQVGSIDELKSTDYGRLLIAKLVAFAALIVAAAFSREVVNRRFRDLPPDDDDELVPADDPVLVGAGGRGAPVRRRSGERRRRRRTAAARRRYDPTGTTTSRGPGGDDAPAPLGVGRGRDRGGDPRHHRDAGERGAGARAEHRAGVAHAEVAARCGCTSTSRRAWPDPTTCTSPRSPPAVVPRPSPT